MFASEEKKMQQENMKPQGAVDKRALRTRPHYGLGVYRPPPKAETRSCVDWKKCLLLLLQCFVLFCFGCWVFFLLNETGLSKKKTKKGEREGWWKERRREGERGRMRIRKNEVPGWVCPQA